MTTIQRVKTTLTGFTGGPGVATMYFDNSLTPPLADVRTFWDTLKSLFPNTLTAQVENVGDRIEAETGDLLGAWSGAAQASVVGTSASGYPGPAGAMVRWRTADVVNSHRVSGKTFLVPMVNAVYDTNGTLMAASITTILGAGAALVTASAGRMVVWSRPFEPVPPATEPEAREGSAHVVTSATVPDKSVVLRSRRD